MRGHRRYGRWHPCLWFVSEDVEGAAVDHHGIRRTLVDLGEWEAEVRRG